MEERSRKLKELITEKKKDPHGPKKLEWEDIEKAEEKNRELE